MNVQTGDPCVQCGRPMVGRRTFAKDPSGWGGKGYVMHQGHHRCVACFTRLRRRPDGPERINAPKQNPVDILAAYGELPPGLTLEEAAQRLGMNRRTLGNALYRARKRTGAVPPKRTVVVAKRCQPQRRPSRRLLAPDELARLRAAVGLPAVLPSERAS